MTDLLFHILQLGKSLPFQTPEAWRSCPFRAGPPCVGHYMEYRPPPPPPHPHSLEKSRNLYDQFTCRHLHASVVLMETILHSPFPKAFSEFIRTSYNVLASRSLKVLLLSEVLRYSDLNVCPSCLSSIWYLITGLPPSFSAGSQFTSMLLQLDDARMLFGGSERPGTKQPLQIWTC